MDPNRHCCQCADKAQRLHYSLEKVYQIEDLLSPLGASDHLKKIDKTILLKKLSGM